MAKTFDPSQLSPADQAAFAQWQQQLLAYVAQNGGAISAPVSYALAHPEYLQQHPELRQDVDIVSGAMLPPTTRDALKDFHPVWSGDKAGNFQKDSGLFNKWETWLQLGLAGAVGGVGAAGALGGAAAPAGAATTGGTTAAAASPAAYIGSDIAGTAATAGGGASALVPTTITGLTTPGVGTVATSPAFAAGGSTGAAATGGSIWDKIFGKTTADKVMTGLGMAGGLAGSLIQSNQADKATKAQQEAAAKALELQSNIYQQQRADLAPYRQAGASSLSALTYGLGLDPSKSADTTTPYFQQQFAAQQNAVPQNAQRNPNSPTTQPIPAGNYTGGQAVPRVSSLAPTASDGTVSMFAPDGRQARVPQNQVQAALNAGGRLA